MFLEELIVHRKASGVTMTVFNTGSVRARGASVSSMKSWSAKVRLDVPVFLIRHPTQGTVLFDTGLSTSSAKRLNSLLTGLAATFDSASGQDAASQLKAFGVDPSTVSWVILSHLHLDHAGSVDLFPNATVVVSKKEWEAQKARMSLKRSAREFDPAAHEGRLKLKLVGFDGAKPLGTFDRAVDLFEDGALFLIDLPGHTPGSIGAWVNLDGGPVLLAGDASWIVDNHMDLALPAARAIGDLDAYGRSLHAMRAMQEAVPRLVIFPGHDLTPRVLSGRPDLPLAVFPAGP